MASETSDVLTTATTIPVAVDVNERHKADLLEQFYLTLRVTYSAVGSETGGNAETVPDIRRGIDRLFKRPPSWQNAYEIEQFLCFLLNDAQLDTELRRRLAEARAVKLEHMAAIEDAMKGDTIPPSTKRIVLHRLMNDLQWFYSKRVQHRAASKRLMVRVSRLFIAALVLFSLVLFIQFFAHAPANGGGREASNGLATPGPRPNSSAGMSAASAAVQSTEVKPNVKGDVK